MLARSERMSTDVQPVFELGRKLRGLMDWAASTGHEACSVHGIARASGIARGTLNSNIEREQMAPDNQEALATACGFRADWPEWRDPAAVRTTPADQRRDSATAFLDRFFAHLAAGRRLTIEAGITKSFVDRRFAEFAFALPGSFEPAADAGGIPLVLSLSFDRRGWPAFPDLTVGLKEVDVQLFHARKPEAIEAVELACRGEAEGNFHGAVEGHSPYWIISVVAGDDACLAGRRRRNDGRDCECRGFRPGDEIRARMTARVSDCFVRLSGQPFDDASEAKKRFIDHLIKLEALGGAEATLGEQVLQVVET